jgi:hypothetical protein
MTYQGKRARPIATEDGRFFEVSKVRIDPDGHVSGVLWCEVDAGADRATGAPVEATAAEVVDAIHDGAYVAAVFSAKVSLPERMFVVVEHTNGKERIVLDGAASSGRNLTDLGSLDDRIDRSPRAPGALAAEGTLATRTGGRSTAQRPHPSSRKPNGTGIATFAVSKVRLDPAGRITAVFWGQVDTAKNDWAAPEVEAPVAAAVDALHAGDQVFALFSSTHGHLPDRRFVVADYDGDRKTIVLDGPTAYEREVHDMDRLL